MKTSYRGVVHGKTIELPQETGLPEGQEVAVSIEPVAPCLALGEGLKLSAGGWAEDAAELDEYLDWNRKQRKASGGSIE